MEKQIDAVVLAGDRAASKPVFGKNKSFLEIRGLPLVLHVVNALQGAETIRSIHLVGPENTLRNALQTHSKRLESNKPVHVHPQYQSVWENAWRTFLATIEGYTPGGEKDRPEWYHKAVFVISADIPLLTSREVDYFIRHADMDHFDFCAGMTEEKHLRYYYPTETKPGMRPAYFYFKEITCRMNNLFLAVPFRMKHVSHIQSVYDNRHQKQFLNVIGLTIELIRKHSGLLPVLHYLLLRLALFFDMIHLDFMVQVVRRLVELKTMERELGDVVGCRFCIITTPHGGATLDIDQESDFDIIDQMYDDWVRHQNSIDEKNV